MAEIAEELLRKLYPYNRGLEVLVDKTIAFLGDSVMRGMYKDMVKFIKTGDILKAAESKKKGEISFHDDILVYGGDKLAKKTNGKEFREYRVIKCDNGIIVKYHYICRAFNDHVESIIENFMLDPPDIVVVNSCLWDLHRYEKKSAMEKFKDNVLKLAEALSKIRVPTLKGEGSPPLLIWTTTPPCECDVAIIEDFTEVTSDPDAYNFTAQIDELNSANIWLQQMLPRFSFNVIDLGTVMAKAIQYREKDGVHWNAVANRMFTMLILSRIEMHLARPGKQQIPTIIFSPLLYVSPAPPAPPPVQPVTAQLPPPKHPPPPHAKPPQRQGILPTPRHQPYYEGGSEFNDRYGASFGGSAAGETFFGERQYETVKEDPYQQPEAWSEAGGPGYEDRHYGPPPSQRGEEYYGEGAYHEERTPYVREGPPPPPRGHPPHRPREYANPYSDYSNKYSYNDIQGAVSEQRGMWGPGPPPGPNGPSRGRVREYMDRRPPMREPRPPLRSMGPQHRHPPVRHVPPPRQSRRQRPY